MLSSCDDVDVSLARTLGVVVNDDDLLDAVDESILFNLFNAILLPVFINL